MNGSTLCRLLRRAEGALRIVGLMSGTSVDGIDAAFVEVSRTGEGFAWRLISFACVPWPPEMRAAIHAAFRREASLPALVALDTRIGEAFAEAASHVVGLSGAALESVDAIASHGQTVWHQAIGVEVGGVAATGTLQLGDGNVIAARTGCVVVSDFRRADMALGGQGAPLVPFIDYALFAHPGEGRLVVNLGGIANLTWLPAACDLESVRAFDTGPANMILDSLAARHTGGRLPFDRDGLLAESGAVNIRLLERLLLHPFFARTPPKSTGREEFGEPYVAELLALADEAGCHGVDLIATATALTAETIGRAYDTWIRPHAPVTSVILGGGGVHNRALMRRLAERFAPADVFPSANFGLPADAKEAVAFAILAYETLNGRPANVPAATGALGPAVLGKISIPPPVAGSMGTQNPVDFEADSGLTKADRPGYTL